MKAKHVVRAFAGLSSPQGDPTLYSDPECLFPLTGYDWLQVLDRIGAESGEVLKITIERDDS